jgi:hypothetical protein
VYGYAPAGGSVSEFQGVSMSVLNNINDFAFKKLDEYKHGLRWIDLYSLIKDEYPGMEDRTIIDGIKNFYSNNTSQVYKPEKGLYKLVKNNEVIFASVDPDVYEKDNLSSNKIEEKKFYESFAAWLVDDLEECTKAKVLGNNVFGDKWGTPDIIGISKSLPTDTIKKEIEITSVEIKYDRYQLITAFGQACSYKLFSHKVYIAIPEQSKSEEKERLDSLCFLYGIGLVLFDDTDPNPTNFKLKNRAQKGTPDIDFLNKKIERAKDFFIDLLS